MQKCIKFEHLIFSG